jgi:hypothetical protein
MDIRLVYLFLGEGDFGMPCMVIPSHAQNTMPISQYIAPAAAAIVMPYISQMISRRRNILGLTNARPYISLTLASM